MGLSRAPCQFVLSTRTAAPDLILLSPSATSSSARPAPPQSKPSPPLRTLSLTSAVVPPVCYARRQVLARPKHSYSSTAPHFSTKPPHHRSAVSSSPNPASWSVVLCFSPSLPSISSAISASGLEGLLGSPSSTSGHLLPTSERSRALAPPHRQGNCWLRR